MSSSPTSPFFLWLRAVAGHKLSDLHRHHLGARMRDARREVSLHAGRAAGGDLRRPGRPALGHLTRPSEAAVRAERKVRLQTALNAMDPIDREVLALRHFEQLTVSETAQVLGIKEKAAGMRYVRALRRLKEILHEPRRLAGALTMSESTSGPDLFNQLADEFAERYRRGERPSLSEYTDKYPDLADQIRELFPALVVMEQFGTGGDQATGVGHARAPTVQLGSPSSWATTASSARSAAAAWAWSTRPSRRAWAGTSR